MFVALDSPDPLPARLPSPFALPPHPLAVRAAHELRDRVAALDEGKMFGVLVVADGARVGYLSAFSGTLGGRWEVDGFVGPVFDRRARDAWWPAAEVELGERTRELAALDAALAPVHGEHAAIVARHRDERDALRAVHLARRQARRAARTRLEPEHEVAGLVRRDATASDVAIQTACHALDQASRGDTAERRRLLERHATELAALDERLAALTGERDDRARAMRQRSRELLRRVHDTYAIANARGEPRRLAELFAPGEPPGGAGDCAAPKLFAHAYRVGLRPIALAELWLGPPGAGRHPGTFYPPCRGKCGPILAHALVGLDVEPAPVFGTAAIAASEPRVVFEDAWIVVVDKPCGLLSVPGRGAALTDSVLTRLRARLPNVQLVHRLDLDASGLLLAAKAPDTHARLQAMFARREIVKRYAAILEGRIDGERGTIDLPLRVDVDDRPRQIVDHAHGKPAVTDWEVVARAGERTRVALFPRTGRTHQLRVHAATALAPIAGDRLYARSVAPGERLRLHAESLAFDHPHAGRVELASPPPF